MKIANNVEMLELESDYPVLLWDDDNVILIDTGLPGQFDLIKSEMAKVGLAPEQITMVILTHQDLDHIGNLKTIRNLGARVAAYADEAPYIQGDKPPIKLAGLEANLEKLPPELLEFYHMLKQGMPGLVTPVDMLLYDSEVLQACGGIEVIHTPGHTPGHIALRLLASDIIITGDAANKIDGKLCGATPEYTDDMATAEASFEKIKALKPAGFVCYHGGYASGEDVQ